MTNTTEGKSRFDVLGTMRALRDDETLTATQLVVLLCAVMRTDNATCKVKLSIEGIAKDANVTEKTARTVFKHPAALHYMAKVEGRTRAKDMWFHPTPVTGTGVVRGIENEMQSIPVTEEVTPVTDASIPETVTVLLPSLLPSPSTNNGATAPVEAKEEQEEGSRVSLASKVTDSSLPVRGPSPSLLEMEAAPGDANSAFAHDLKEHSRRWTLHRLKCGALTALDYQKMLNEEAAIYTRHGVKQAAGW